MLHKNIHSCTEITRCFLTNNIHFLGKDKATVQQGTMLLQSRIRKLRGPNSSSYKQNPTFMPLLCCLFAFI